MSQGNGPPRDVSDVDLYARALQMPRPYEVVDYPRTDPATGEPVAKIALWILTELEILQAHAAATKWVRESLKANGDQSDHGYLQIYNNELYVQMLQRSARRMRKDESGGWAIDPRKLPVWPAVGDLRAGLMHDEIAVLFNAYIIAQKLLGPITSELTREECKAWIDRLGAGGEVMGASFFSWGALFDLARFSASQMQSLRTSLSSRGLQLDDDMQLSEIPPTTTSSETEPPASP